MGPDIIQGVVKEYSSALSKARLCRQDLGDLLGRSSLCWGGVLGGFASLQSLSFELNELGQERMSSWERWKRSRN